MQTILRSRLNPSYFYKLRKENACDIPSGVKAGAHFLSILLERWLRASLSLDANASYPLPSRPHPRYLIPEGIHLVFEELPLYLGSVLVHSLQTRTFMSTRKTLVPSRRVMSVRTWKIHSWQIVRIVLRLDAIYLLNKIWTLRFKILGLWWAFFLMSFFFLFANHGCWS